MREPGERLHRYLARRFGKRIATVVVGGGAIIFFLFSNCSCSSPGTLEDVGHEASVTSVAFAGATLASGGNFAVGGAVAAAVWLADAFVPDGEEARDEVQQENYEQLAKDQVEALLQSLIANGLVEAVAPELKKGIVSEVETRVQAIEASREEDKESIVEQLTALIWTIVYAAIAIAVLWVVATFLIRRFAQKKEISFRESMAADLAEAKETISELRGKVEAGP